MPKTQPTEQEKALAVHAKLAAVDLAAVPVISTERLFRKQLAPAARALLKSLGIKGVSVTTPNYSMAQSVDVRLPERKDYVFDAAGFVIDGDLARKANNDAREKLEAILLAAFPATDNRSDTQTDYFDYCWSVR